MPDLIYPLYSLKGRIVHLTINSTNGKKHSPPGGKIWYIMNGTVYHVTGTETTFYIYHAGSAGAAKTVLLANISAATASMPYPLGVSDNTYTAGAGTHIIPVATFNPVLINSAFEIILTGDATNSAELLIWEMDQPNK